MYVFHVGINMVDAALLPFLAFFGTVTVLRSDLKILIEYILQTSLTHLLLP